MVSPSKSWLKYRRGLASNLGTSHLANHAGIKAAFFAGFGAGDAASLGRYGSKVRLRPTINANEADALRRIRDQGPLAWAKGKGRAGGAVRRMFDRMRERKLVSAPPFVPTKLGREELDKYDAWHRPLRVRI